MSGIQLKNSATMVAPSGHYSHAVCSAGFVFVSGLLPLTPDGDKVEAFDDQVKLIFKNIEAILSECDSDKNHLVQVRVYLKDIDLWPKLNQLYAEWLGDHRPARCVVPVPTLHGDVDIEIEATARQKDY
jgi:2-iminobutanoate/2-iminopropanoate deaminase